MEALESRLIGAFDEKSQKIKQIPLDYFSWGRDVRHSPTENNVFSLKDIFSKRSVQRFLRKLYYAVNRQANSKEGVLARFHQSYSGFESTYLLMSNESSKQLFAELVLMHLLSEKNMRLSTFTHEFITSYEKASEEILSAQSTLKVYDWQLHKVFIPSLNLNVYTGPEVLNLLTLERLYQYHAKGVDIHVEPGDIVIDAGVGVGDTSVYFASLCADTQMINDEDEPSEPHVAKPSGWVYSFEIVDEGLQALEQQLAINPQIKNVTAVKKAVFEKDGEIVSISEPGTDTKIMAEDSEQSVETITIDSFAKQENVPKIDFIKMDIEGAEIPALRGCQQTIKAFKPKLAICVYHKWDDLLTIPSLIHSIRQDYEFYLDCTTGFGGEAVLYCR